MAKKTVAAAPAPALFKSYNFELSPAIQGIYELRNTHCAVLNWRGKNYDLRTITLADAKYISDYDDTFLYKVNPDAE